ncbi:MAG: sigma-70 family RNA polymerase sigma factor [Planctomycetota bacterium]
MSHLNRISEHQESGASLARRALRQDSGATTTLVARYQPFVYRICFAILRHREDAEDATQDTLSRIVKYLDRWDPRRPLEPWIATVAGNRSRSKLARRKRYAPLTSVAEPASSASVERQSAEAMREEMDLAIRKLPPRQRLAFEAFHRDALAYAEIAERLNCPVGTVKTLVHRARKRLIDELSEREVFATRRRGA